MVQLSLGCRSIVCASLLAFGAVTLAPNPAWAMKPPKGKQATTGKLSLFSLVQGAVVEIDGRSVGKTPLPGPIELTPGTHTLRVYARGHTEVADELTITAGATTEYEADLIAVAGIVRVTANVPGATVAIDGKAAGTVPFDEDIAAGKHEIIVQAPGHQPFKQSVELEGGKGFDLAVTLQVAIAVSTDTPEDDPIYKKWWFWTIIGAVTVGGAVTGIMLGLPEDVPADSDAQLRLP
jgi:hypothetical protein